MREATRRQILSDMGIVRWQLRTTATAVEQRNGRAPHPAPPASEAGGRGREVAREAPWSALSIASGGVLLLVPGDNSRRDLRLATDLLAAASGDWQTRPVSRRFDWPGAAGREVTQAPDGGRRALTAFIDKDLADHDVRLLLCVKALRSLLPESLPRCRSVEIPALETLGRDPDAKRLLWQSLREISV